MKSTIAGWLTSVISLLKFALYTDRSVVCPNKGSTKFSMKISTAWVWFSTPGKHLIPSWIKNLMKHPKSNFSLVYEWLGDKYLAFCTDSYSTESYCIDLSDSLNPDCRGLNCYFLLCMLANIKSTYVVLICMTTYFLSKIGLGYKWVKMPKSLTNFCNLFPLKVLKFSGSPNEQ